MRRAIAAILVRELEKYAAYFDAAPDAPKPLDREAVDALGAASKKAISALARQRRRTAIPARPKRNSFGWRRGKDGVG